MRLVFFGTPKFAVPTLERLLEGRHPVVAVVTQPDRPRGRGRRPSASPVAEIAQRAGIPVLKPERVSDPGFVDALRAVAPDLGVVVAYGQFLGRRVRQAPRLGYLINAHASLLPRYRGANPIAHAILAGEEETGVCIMRVEREMDAGPVATVSRTSIGPDESAGELAERLARLAAAAVEETIEAIARGEVRWTEQDHGRASYAPKIERGDTELDWREPAEVLARRVRALAPRPGAVTQMAGEPLRILAARAVAGPVEDPPGTLRFGESGDVRIATGRGWLVPCALQRAGGRPLEARAFLRGKPLAEGFRLGARGGDASARDAPE